MCVMTCPRHYEKTNREGIWTKKTPDCNLKILVLDQIWTEYLYDYFTSQGFITFIHIQSEIS